MAGTILLLIFLTISTLMDIKNKSVNLYLCIFFLILGVGYNTFLHLEGVIGIGDIIVATIPGFILLLLSLVTRQGIGFGDGVVVIIMGMLIGFERTVTSLMVGLIVATIFSGVLIMIKKVEKNHQIPFIPFLSIGVDVIVLGEVIGR